MVVDVGFYFQNATDDLKSYVDKIGVPGGPANTRRPVGPERARARVVDEAGGLQADGRPWQNSQTRVRLPRCWPSMVGCQGKGPVPERPGGGFTKVFAEHGRPPASHGAVDLIPRGVGGRWTVLPAPRVVLRVAFLYLLLYPGSVAKTGVGGIRDDRLLFHNNPVEKLQGSGQHVRHPIVVLSATYLYLSW